MGKIISILLLCIMVTSCQSQHKKKEIKSKPTISVKSDAEYFLGTWKFVEKKYLDGTEKKIYPLHECMKKYYLVFEKENGNLFLTKNYATGKDCTIKSSSGKITVVINQSSFSYWDADLKKLDQYKILSKDKFSIVYSDILDGKVREIEDVYER
ncbi:lipocalin family protein [Chryseobacterium sp. G0201]|uniref:lipocalin family protein n=1 Tax=Chryseobacterium sp. G0201 TaxID=2487065 RepID=UPI000F4ED053|nr:lipocalin family protein [Chryseobacterium sp. G0201]AZA52342.1 hypothetical protein EG348_04640 [Chryseobacterium sp. G0201]